MSEPYVVAITGASGAKYARRLLEVLAAGQEPVHLVISGAGEMVMRQELGIEIKSAPHFDLADLWPAEIRPPDLPSSDSITRFALHNYFSPIASGSHRTRGMIVCPCSGSTLSAIATGACNNLVHRAADVHLKERRPLVLVPRETPISLIHINNMRTVVEAGAIMLPASPGWYHGEMTADDLVDFVVARILDQLSIPHELSKRWGSDR